MYSVRIFCTTVLFGFTVLAESPTSTGYGNDLGFNSPNLKGIRYAGPIVYTNEKPPVIHFPPPPPVSTAKNFHGITKGKSVKYVPMPTHDLPILIYTSDVSPPLHVVSPQPSAHQSTTSKGNRERLQSDYSNPAASFSSKPSKSHNSSKSRVKKPDSYRTVESYPERPRSHSSSGGSGTQSFYERFPFAQSLKELLGRSASFKSYMSSAAPARTKTPKRKQSFNSDTIIGEFSTKNEVVTKPRSSPKQSSPLPHIIYTGHAPIHIFNQSPVHVPKSQQQAYSQTTHDYQESQSAPKPSYAPIESSSRYRESKTETNYGFTKYTKYNQPGYYSNNNNEPTPSNSRSTKSSYDYTQSSIGGNTYKYKPTFGATKSPYPTRPTNRVKQDSYFSSKPYTKNRYSHVESKKKKTKSQAKTAPSKQYSSAPSAFKKPPIIIYQGLYPPHHVFENPTVDYHAGQTSAPALPQHYGQSITNRMSDDHNVGMPKESAQTGLDTDFSPVPMSMQAQQPEQPSYYLPTMEYSPAPAAMYVSDLTSQGTLSTFAQQPQFYTIHPNQNTGDVQSPQTHTIQVQNSDGSYSTAQVMTTTLTTADQAANPSTVSEAHIDSIPTFLAASLNNQNNPLVPMSLSSIVVQSAGAQPHSQFSSTI